MAAYRGDARREMLEKVSFCRKTAKIERSPSPESHIFRSQASFFRLQALCSARHAPLSRLISPHERRSRNMTVRIGRISAPAVPANFGHFRKNLHLISLHERRSRNMMARVVQRELAISARQQRNRRRTCSFWPFPLTIPPK